MKAYNKKLYKNVIEENYRQYTIPVYQRSYSWQKKECNQLYDDVIDSIKKKRNHYLGSLVYLEVDKNNFTCCPIIDGQQRLTTVILLLKALYDSIDDPNSRIKNRIYDSIYNDNCEDRYKLKLKSIDSDNEELEKVLMGNMNDLDSSSNISINYFNFIDRIKKSLDENISIEDLFEGITNLEIVEIILGEDDDPQLIFESINSTGKNLDTSDLIRNFLLMGFKDPGIQKEYYKKYWVKLQNDIGKENVEKFFYDFLVMQDLKFIEEKRVYENFKTYYRNVNDTDKIFDEIVAFGEYYKLLTRYDSNLYSNKTNKLCSMFGLLKHNTIYPFLLKICDDFKDVQYLRKNNNDFNISTLQEREEEFNQILSLLVNYALRRSVAEIPSSSLRRFYASLYNKIFGKNEGNLNHYYKSIESYLCTVNTSDRMPSDNTFIDSLCYKNLYKKSRILRYFFEFIENDNKEPVDMSDLTIEHIMPETLSNNWKKDLGDNYQDIYDKYVHTLGNLSITGYNSEYSNSQFVEKKKLLYELQDSDKTKITRLNKEMLDPNIKSWGENEILDRAKRLSNIIISKYPYPQNIDTTLEFEKYYEFYIEDEDDDAGLYVDSPNYKLYGFQFDGIKYRASYFKNIFIEIIKILYNINPTIIDELAERKFKFESGSRIVFSKECAGEWQTQVFPNLYVQTNYNRHMIFWWIRELLNKYQIELSNFCILFIDND